MYLTDFVVARVLTLYDLNLAISDAITIVSILQDSDIARYHGMYIFLNEINYNFANLGFIFVEVESFSLEESRGVIKPCLLFRLHVLK